MSESALLMVRYSLWHLHPKGLASIVLVPLALDELKVFPDDTTFITVVSVTVLLSVFAMDLQQLLYLTFRKKNEQNCEVEYRTLPSSHNTFFI